MTRRSVRALARAALGVALLGGAASCHSRLPRLAARGQYDEVIERAQASRFAPRRKAARAYAKALTERGDTQQAMAVLLKDYRRGGQIPSLVALADLERAVGWDGLAAHHYTRVVALDHKALLGREDVCNLFRERARAYLDASEGVAADLDARRVRFLCPEPTGVAAAARDRKLQAAADAAADALVDARVAGTACHTDDCSETRTSDRIAAVEQALAEGTAGSAAQLAAASELHASQVAPKDLSRLILADLRGELGSDPVTDDTVRRWVGDQTWSDLAPAVMSQDAAVAGYVQLRLASIVADLPTGPDPRRGASQLERWADRAVEMPGARAWRLFAWRGDLAAAELELSSTWRPKPTPAATGAPTDKAAKPPDTATEPAPAHWSARAVMTPESAPELLVVARMRRASGQEDLALELTRFNLRRAFNAGLPEAIELAHAEALRAIAWGRPWHAIAIADATDSAELADLRAAAASSITLAQALCTGPCRDDEDRATVTRVLGEAWIDKTLAQLHSLALGNRSRASGTHGCPTLAEVLAADAVGPLAEAMRLVRTPKARAEPGRGEALTGALAADLRAWCSAQFVLPVMAHAGYAVSAGRLADALAHVPEMRASRDLVVHAKLALVASQHDRAEQLAIRAAAASDTPRLVWADLARFAAATDDRDLELMALRETLLHSPSLEHRGARRRMLLQALADFGRSWAATQPVGREAIGRHVSAYLDGLAPAARWAEREALVAAVLDAHVLTQPLRPRVRADTDLRAEVAGALFGAAKHSVVHRRAMAQVRGIDPGPAWSNLHAAGLAEDARRGRIRRVPKLTEAIADPAQFEALRLALAEHARDWQLRWRMAIGLAAYGTAPARRRATRQLRAMAAEAGPAAMAAVDDLIMQRPAAVQPTAAAISVAAVVADTDALLHILLALE